MMTFPRAGIRCSVWLPIGVAFFTGWLAGVLGIGGGLIRMPSLIYLIGCPTHVAVGTELFEIAVSGLYGEATYSYQGRVELWAAFIMLIGAAVGAQIGAVATKYVKGYGIRTFFGCAVIGCDVSVLMKIIAASHAALKSVLDISATILILGLVSPLSLAIVVKFVLGVREELAQKRNAAELKAAAQTRQATLIRESPGAGSDPGVLPPVTVEAPADPNEMGPSPAAGGLLLLDTGQRRIVIYDRAMQSFRTIHYAPLAERHIFAEGTYFDHIPRL